MSELKPQPELQNTKQLQEMQLLERSTCIAKPLKTSDKISIKKQTISCINEEINGIISVKNQLLYQNKSGNYSTKTLEELNSSIKKLKSLIHDSTLKSLKSLTRWLPTTVNNLAQNAKKKIDLYYKIEPIQINKQLLEQLKPNINSILEFIILEGIDSSQSRIADNKSENSKLEFSAKLINNIPFIFIAYEGRVLNSLPKTLQHNLNKLGLSYSEFKIKGHTNTIEIKLPQQDTILEVLNTKICDQDFAFPIVNMLGVHKAAMTLQDQDYVINVQDKCIPVINLQEAINIGSQISNNILLFEFEEKKYGIAVDSIENITELVLEQVGIITDIPEYLGAAISARKQPILILNPIEFIKKINNKDLLKNKHIIASENTSRLLLFKTHDSTYVQALPAEYVQKIINFIPSSLLKHNGHTYYIEGDKKIKIVNTNSSHIAIANKGFLVVIKYKNEDIGFIAKEIDSIINHQFDSQIIRTDDPRYLSAIIIDDQAVEILNLDYFIQSDATIAKKEPKILVIDESSFFRRFIPPTIKAAGYDVITTDKIEAALDCIQNNDIMLVLIDLNLQLNTKVDLKNHTTAPIIGLSSFNSSEIKSKLGKKSHFDAYVPKTHHAKIMETISKLLNK